MNTTMSSFYYRIEKRVRKNWIPIDNWKYTSRKQAKKNLTEEIRNQQFPSFSPTKKFSIKIPQYRVALYKSVITERLIETF